MGLPSGTHTLSDLRANRSQSVVEYGLNTVDEVLRRDLAVYNAIVNEIVMDLADVTTDRQRIYGTSNATAAAKEADEFDPGVAKKPDQTGVTCGFPLRKYPFAIGWTREYFMSATPADVAEAMIATQQSHTQTIYRDVRNALFGATNTTYRERHDTPIVDLAVKALVNADSASIPNGPNGETFNGASHTHYDYLDSTVPTEDALNAQIRDVVEHGHGQGVRIYINQAAETAVRALYTFVPYPDPRIVYRTADTPGTTLDLSRLDNRAIGLFGAAEVWVKPWVPSGYTFCYASGDSRKPLVYRQHRVAALQGLRIANRLDSYPLYADQMESYFGFGVWNRTNGHVLYYASGASAYVAPTIS